MSKSPPPIIFLPPSNVTAAPKSNIALDCLSHNATTRWYKDGKPVLTGSGRLQLLSSGSLKINNLQVQIVGIFATFWNWQQLHAYLINLSTRIIYSKNLLKTVVVTKGSDFSITLQKSILNHPTFGKGCSQHRRVEVVGRWCSKLYRWYRPWGVAIVLGIQGVLRSSTPPKVSALPQQKNLPSCWFVYH